MRDRDYGADIAKAIATPGGYLKIGRGGFSLHYLNAYGGQSSLSGYDCDTVKLQTIAAGLPVIDSRCVDFDKVTRLVISGPMICVGGAPEPEPWGAFSYAPLIEVARAYAAAGAEVYNLDLEEAAGAAA
ncbi:hypothetical protein H2509_00245 [Stappia sp. F7233]|uniref:Uncharacterized protein n=1 Tax=Stappia albiluteola TaxID=2758565 RepID=A0A839A9V3_9HYPH|nr:hypothetical protein [Stappia albiluteola]MBA5775549.1 hypothetical protein [Stappia albiluteola]